jgi:hypothetical protein
MKINEVVTETKQPFIKTCLRLCCVDFVASDLIITAPSRGFEALVYGRKL